MPSFRRARKINGFSSGASWAERVLGVAAPKGQRVWRPREGPGTPDPKSVQKRVPRPETKERGLELFHKKLKVVAEWSTPERQIDRLRHIGRPRERVRRRGWKKNPSNSVPYGRGSLSNEQKTDIPAYHPSPTEIQATKTPRELFPREPGCESRGEDRGRDRRGGPGQKRSKGKGFDIVGRDDEARRGLLVQYSGEESSRARVPPGSGSCRKLSGGCLAGDSESS